MKALPGVAPSKAGGTAAFAVTPAEPIPVAVLINPIIGEARRFDGTTPPNPRWVLAQGQETAITENRPLFSILGFMAGGDRKTTFKMPKPALGHIIAVAGLFPSSPQALVQSGRHMFKHEDMLGDGARIPIRTIRPERPGVIESRQLSARALRVGASRWTPLSSAMEARIAATESEGRSEALARLDPSNRNTIAALTDAVASGRSSVLSAVQIMSRSLSGAEAAALLDVNDRMFAAFRSAWSGTTHPNPQFEAAKFLVSVAFTPEQMNALRRIS